MAGAGCRLLAGRKAAVCLSVCEEEEDGALDSCFVQFCCGIIADAAV